MSALDKLHASDAENHARMMEALDRISSPFSNHFLPHAFSLPSVSIGEDGESTGDAVATTNAASTAVADGDMDDGCADAAAAVATAHLLLDAPDAAPAVHSACVLPSLDLSLVCAPISPLSHIASPVAGPAEAGSLEMSDIQTAAPRFIDVALHNIVGSHELASSEKKTALSQVAGDVFAKRPRSSTSEARSEGAKSDTECGRSGCSGTMDEACIKAEVVQEDGGASSISSASCGSPAASPGSADGGNESMPVENASASGSAGVLDAEAVKGGAASAADDGAATDAKDASPKAMTTADNEAGKCDGEGEAEKAPLTPTQKAERARGLRRAAITRFRLKKKANKLKPKSQKFIRYDCRKVLACQRPRGRFPFSFAARMS